MNLMKRLGMAALLAIGFGLLASTTAQAGADYGTIELASAGIDEPEATGQATVKDARYEGVSGEGDTLYWIRASVACQNLRPHATYWTPVGTFTADAKGQGKVTGRVLVNAYYSGSWLDWLYSVTVWRVNEDGSRTLVLASSIHPW